ncbi:hypothetical protein BD560DRAFT_380953 [Blakeslea trispora]|nr:hypothetical protein BD560DRAFT_380953 [Blakeslea trispora]
MPKQKTNKSFKTLRFSSTRGFDRNQRMLTSLFNRANSANGIDSQTNEWRTLLRNETKNRSVKQLKIQLKM